MSVINLQSVQEREILPGCWARFVHTQHLTVAHWRLEAGAHIPEHAHPHEQVVNVIAGEFELVLGGKRRLMKSDQAAVAAANEPHGGTARTPCRIIDVFYPVREDYR